MKSGELSSSWLITSGTHFLKEKVEEVIELPEMKEMDTKCIFQE